MKKYKVIKSYRSEFDNPIKLSKGEHVTIIEKSNPTGDWAGWLLCKSCDNKGWVPHQIVDANGLVIENYDAREFDLDIGEILLAEKELNGWIWCNKLDNDDIKAWAPHNHIEVL